MRAIRDETTTPTDRSLSVVLFDFGGVVLSDASADAVAAVEARLSLDLERESAAALPCPFGCRLALPRAP